MGQQRFKVSAILILFVGFVIFIGLNKINFSGNKKPDVVIIDYDSKNENISNQPPEGKALFSSLCAACHAINSKVVGPPLAGVTERGPWKDFKKLCQYIRNPMSLRNNKYVDSLNKQYTIRHLSYPNLTDEKIKQIFDYINSEAQKQRGPIP